MDEVLSGIANTILGLFIALFISINDLNTIVTIAVGGATFIYMICKIIQIFYSWRKSKKKVENGKAK